MEVTLANSIEKLLISMLALFDPNYISALIKFGPTVPAAGTALLAGVAAESSNKKFAVASIKGIRTDVGPGHVKNLAPKLLKESTPPRWIAVIYKIVSPVEAPLGIHLNILCSSTVKPGPAALVVE